MQPYNNNNFAPLITDESYIYLASKLSQISNCNDFKECYPDFYGGGPRRTNFSDQTNKLPPIKQPTRKRSARILKQGYQPAKQRHFGQDVGNNNNINRNANYNVYGGGQTFQNENYNNYHLNCFNNAYSYQNPFTNNMISSTKGESSYQTNSFLFPAKRLAATFQNGKNLFADLEKSFNESFSENSAKRHCADNDILSLQCEEDYSDDSSSSDIKKVIPPTKGRKQMSKGNSKKTAKKLKNAESAFIFKQIDYDIARIQIGDETQVVNKFELIDRYSKDISLFGENLEVVSLMFEKSDIYPRAHRPGVKSVGRLMGCHRRIIVDWMMEVATVEKLSRTTLHMAVDYIDRAFALKNDFTDKLYQTIAGTCLLIAAKIEEIYPPTIDCFVRHGGGSYTDDYLRKAEVMITGMLGFALHPITAVSFLDYFYSDLQNAIFDSSSNASTSQNSQDESSIDESGFFTQAANAPRGSGIFEEEIITNEERYNPDINPLNPLNRTNKGGYSPEKGEYWAEFGEDLHPDLLRAYLKSFAVLDFVTLTYPSTLFGSRELAAGIIFAQFKEDEGMPTRVLGFTAEDAKRAIHFVEPFFARIDEAQAEYYENYTSLSNRYYDSTRHKIQIYSKKLGEMLEPIEGQTNPLLKHVESFSTI